MYNNYYSSSRKSFWRAVIICCVIAMIVILVYRIFDNAIDAFFQNVFSSSNTSDLFSVPNVPEWN